MRHSTRIWAISSATGRAAFAAAALLATLAAAPAQAAYFVSSDENFSYTGSVTGPFGTTTIPSVAAGYPGIDAFLLASQSAPAAYSQSTLTNYTDFSPNFFSNNSSNPFGLVNTWIGLLDPTNAGVTSATGTWNSTFTTFTLTIDGAQTNPNLSAYSVVGPGAPVISGNNLADVSGLYTNYALTLTANFASPATLQSPWYSWYSTTADPTSVTGSFIGTFQNTSAVEPANNGTYAVDLNFTGQNWAAANSPPPDPYGPYIGASTCGPAPGTSCNFVQGTTNTTGTDIGNGPGNGANLSLTDTVVASASTLTPGSGLTCPPGSATCALQTAVGGDGYDGYDNGGVAGGNGGNGTSTLDNVPGRSGINSVISVGQGGNGGTGGTVGGNGGNGASSLSLANVNSATSVGLGGDAGWGFPGNGGNGGNGTAGLTASGDITATVVATGGNGGDAYIGTGNGGTGGTGTTTPVTATGLAPTDPVTVNVSATGGNGGNVYEFTGPNPGSSGGAGGAGIVSGPVDGISVSTTPGSTGSGPVTIAVQQTGGNGGSATPVTDASGGSAAASTLYTHIVGGVDQPDNVNEINGWTTGPLSITSAATGGAGGDANGTGIAAPGAAGSATLILSQLGLNLTGQASSNLQGAAQGIGGNGGNGNSDGIVTPNGANGATGTAVAEMTGYQTVGATANATGGNGGIGATTGAGGNASATAVATSLTPGFNATAIANATGGAGGTEGEATPLAQAFSLGAGNASATATGTGILTPGNYATAQSTTTSGTTSVAGTAKALIGSTEVSQTVTNVGGAVTVLQPATGSYGGAVSTLPAASNMNASIQAQAYGTALPTSSAVVALLDGHPNALTTFTSPGQVLGVGSLAVANSTSASGTHNYSASLVYTLTPPVVASQVLTVALLDPALVAAPLGSLSAADINALTFTIGDSQFTNTYTFVGDSITQVDDFFTDNVLYLGAMPSTLTDLTFTLSDTMTDLSGFGVNLAFGEVPEPPAWLLFGSALLGMAYFQRRRRAG